MLFKFLQSVGQIDTVINVLYVLLLGTIGSLMFREALGAMRARKGGADGKSGALAAGTGSPIRLR